MIASDAEMAKMDEERRSSRRRSSRKQNCAKHLCRDEVAPEAIDRINSAVRIAAQNGHQQLQVHHLSVAAYCSDGGRRINIADPEWPSTLDGLRQEMPSTSIDKELRPLGYKLHAEIISFPGGMPGDVGALPVVVSAVGSVDCRSSGGCSDDQEGQSVLRAAPT